MYNQRVIHHIVCKGFNVLLAHILNGTGDLYAEAILDIRDTLGNTPLICAVQVPRPEIVEILLDHQASVTTSNLAGQIPLFLAIQWQNPRMVEAIANKCDNTMWFMNDDRYMAALHWAVAVRNRKLKDYMQEEYKDSYKWSGCRPDGVIVRMSKALKYFKSANDTGLRILDLVLSHCLPRFHLHLNKEAQDSIYSEVILLECENGDFEACSRLLNREE